MNLKSYHSLVVWNSKEAQQVGNNNHSIIDLILTSLSIELNWNIVSK